MAPWNDAEVDSDGDELLDWLWDLPERYDVGIEDAPPSAVEGVAAVGPAGVRKHLRQAGDPIAPAPPPPDRADVDGRPTQAVDFLDPFLDDEPYPPYASDDTVLAPFVSGRRSKRFTGRDVAAAIAALMVIIVGAFIGYTIFNSSGGKKKVNTVVAAPATTVSTIDVNAFVPPTDTSTTDTTTSTTVVTTSSVPGAIVVGTTTTVPHKGTTTTTKPKSTTTAATTTTSTTTTTTTVPASTTTTSTSTTTTSTTTTSTTTSTTVMDTIPMP